MGLPVINVLDVVKSALFWGAWVVRNPVIVIGLFTVAFGSVISAVLSFFDFTLPTIQLDSLAVDDNGNFVGFAMYILAADQLIIVFNFIIQLLNLLCAFVPGFIISVFAALFLYGKHKVLMSVFYDFILKRGVG